MFELSELGWQVAVDFEPDADFHNPLAIKNLLVDQFVEAHAHGDAVLAQLQGKAPRENHHLGLRCRVECIAGQRSALIGILLNPNNANAETQSKDVQEAARAIGQKIQIVHAGTEAALRQTKVARKVV